jgi:hypothetical protein
MRRVRREPNRALWRNDPIALRGHHGHDAFGRVGELAARVRVIGKDEARRKETFCRYDVPRDLFIACGYGGWHGPNSCQIDLIAGAEKPIGIYHAVGLQDPSHRLQIISLGGIDGIAQRKNAGAIQSMGKQVDI